MRLATTLVGAAIAALATHAQADGATAKATLCKAAETVLFECAVPRGKLVALCAEPPGRVQYRFGAIGHIELAYPADPSEGPEKLLFAHYFRAGVDRVTVRFVHEGVEYRVFDFEEGNRRSAGVSVRTDPGGVERVLGCRGRIVHRPDEAKAILSCDAESALSDCR